MIFCESRPRPIARRSATWAGAVAADHRVVHVEQVVVAGRLDDRVAADPLLRQVGRDLAVGHRLRRELVADAVGDVGLAVDEREPARLLLLDDRDLDAIDHRQAPPLEAREQRLALGVVGRRLGVVEHLAEVGVALEGDERAAPPLDELERAGADRVRSASVAVELDHLARHRAVEVAAGQGLVEARSRLLEREAHRVAVERADAFDLLVVVERLLLVEGALAQLRQAEIAFRLHARPHRALVRRIGEALPRVDVVLGDELAPLALERRVVGEEDAGPDPRGPDAEVVGVLRHAVGGERLDLHRPRQVVVGVEALEDVRRQRARVQVVDLGRIEAGLGDLEGVAQDLRRHRRADAVVRGRPGQVRRDRARGGARNDSST